MDLPNTSTNRQAKRVKFKKMKFQVEIVGNKADLEYLSKYFLSSDLCIFQKGEDFYLCSSAINNCSNLEMVKNEADRLLIVINTVNILEFHSSKLIRRGGAIRIEDDQGHRSTVTHLTKSLRQFHWYRSPKQAGTIDDITKKLISLMGTNDKIRRVFDLINYDFHSFSGLYKVIEVIMEDGFPPIGRGGEFYDDIDLFKQTSQSYEAIGGSSSCAFKIQKT
jgi:hypothetical protein